MKLARISILFAMTVLGCGGEDSLDSQQEDSDPRIEAAFESVDCPSASTRELDDSYYQGPMIDTHIHIAPIPEEAGETSESPLLGVNVKIADYICMMDYEETSKVFAFFPVWEPITLELLEVVDRTITTYPDRFVPFLMPPDRDDQPDGYPTVDAEELEEMLGVTPDLFQGYGEIGLYEREGGAPELPPDSQRLTEIYPVIRENHLVVYFHLGVGQKEVFESVLEANPDIDYIWHGDQLITSREDGSQNLEDVEEILSNHPNAYYGIDELYGDVWLLRPEVSKEEFLAHFEDYEPLLEEDLATWKGFIESHPDQVLWGTDRGGSAPWSVDPEVALTLNSYVRAFMGRLDPAVQERFAYQNAEQLMEGRGP